MFRRKLRFIPLSIKHSHPGSFVCFFIVSYDVRGIYTVQLFSSDVDTDKLTTEAAMASNVHVLTQPSACRRGKSGREKEMSN